MAKYTIYNNSRNSYELGGTTYAPNQDIFNSNDACAFVEFYEGVLPEAKEKKIPIDERLKESYVQAQKECGVNAVKDIFETYEDPLLVPEDNTEFDGNLDHVEENTDDLGIDVQTEGGVEARLPEDDSPGDNDASLPKGPSSAGEAEVRSDDEERQKKEGADPVNLFTGEFYLEKIDFELPSIGFPFVFIRTYKSGRSFFGPWGYNWDHNYNIYLRVLNNGDIAVNTGTLQEHLYTDSGNSITYNAPRGVFTKLEKQDPLSGLDYILTFKGGMQWIFAKPDNRAHAEKIPLWQIRDTNGNYQELAYDNENRLSHVVDTVGRRISFQYGQCGLLEALRPDFLQDQDLSSFGLGAAHQTQPIEIKYWHANNIEHLSAVQTFPTPDFPNGLLTSYEYDEAQPNVLLRNNITKVIDAKGQTIVENYYGIDSTDDSFNRVVRQYFMGGEYLFKYKIIRYIPPLDVHINDAFLQTELYEPNRPLKVFTFNFRGNLLDERFRLCADHSYRVWSNSYRYNKNGQIIQKYHANGMIEIYRYAVDPDGDGDYVDDMDVFVQGNLRDISLKYLNVTRTIQQFTYEPLYQKIRTIKDEANVTTEFIYDQDLNAGVITGNLRKIKHSDATLIDGSLQDNCIQTYNYDDKGQLIQEINPAERTTTYDYFLNGNGAGLVRTITLEDDIAPLSRTYEYDALGYVSRIIEGNRNDSIYKTNLAGQVFQIELPVVDENRAIRKFEYNEDRKISREYIPKGAYSDNVLIGDWIINEYKYDVASWLKELTRNANTEFPQTTRYLRDFQGNVIKETNPIGQETRFKYDERNLLLEQTVHSHSASPLKTIYVYNRVGDIEKIISPDETEQSFKYDGFNRVQSIINQLDNVRQYSYENGRIKKIEVKPSQTAEPIQTYNFFYDEKGRVKESSVNGLSSKVLYDKDDLQLQTVNHLEAVTAFEYDRAGRVIKTTDHTETHRITSYDPNGNIASIKTEFTSLSGSVFSFNQQFKYDDRNRRIQTIDPLRNTITFRYDDRNLPIQVMNSLRQRTNIFYDINGLPVSTSIFKQDGNEYTIYRCQRDLIGRLTAFEDAEGNTTRYTYDERGLPVDTIFPDESSINKAYNPLGFLQSEKDANGTITFFHYNSFSQLIRLSFQTAPNVIPTRDILFEYDAFGRTSKITQDNYVVTKRFDEFSRLIEEQQGEHLIKKTFDDINNKFVLQYPDEREDTYQLDLVGRLKDITFSKRGISSCFINDFGEGTKIAEYTYDGIFMVRKKYANRTETEYRYNSNAMLASIIVKNSAGDILDDESYLYDGEKRKKLVLRAGFPNRHKFYNYDELSRLTAAYEGFIPSAIPANLPDQQTIDNYLRDDSNFDMAPNIESYTLSDNDRRTAWGINGTQYNTVHNELLQLRELTANDGTDIQYAYDKNGNRTSDNEYNYFYDAFDNLVRVVRKSDNLVLLENRYDPKGRLLRRIEGVNDTSFLYDGLSAIQQINQAGKVSQYIFGMGLDEYIVQSGELSNYFYHQNNLLSVNSVSDKNGNVLQYFDFGSFGHPFIFSGARVPVPLSDSLINVIFGGRPLIQSIAKYDFRKRIYDQDLGLFFQRDMLNYVDSSNLYVYCKHNASNNIDLLGNCSKEDDSKSILEGKFGYFAGAVTALAEAGENIAKSLANARTATENITRFRQDLYKTVGEFLTSEKNSEKEMEAKEKLHGYNPVYNILEQYSIITNGSDSKKNSFDRGKEIANAVLSTLGSFSILLGLGKLANKGLPLKVNKMPAYEYTPSPVVVTKWTSPKEWIYGPYHRYDPAETIRIIVGEQRLLGAPMGTIAGFGLASVNAFEGRLPLGGQGIEFMTKIRPDVTKYGGFLQGGLDNGVRWTENISELGFVMREHKHLGVKPHVELPIRVTKTQPPIED